MPQGLFDGQGGRVATFEIGSGERPTLLAQVDTNGRGPDAVLMTAMAADGVYGTGLNFTLY